jgi:hypothetical protein
MMGHVYQKGNIETGISEFCRTVKMNNHNCRFKLNVTFLFQYISMYFFIDCQKIESKQEKHNG